MRSIKKLINPLKLLLALNIYIIGFALIIPIMPLANLRAYAASTGSLYELELSGGIHLVRIDLSTGATTTIGSYLQNVLPGSNAIFTQLTSDSTNHRVFYGVTNYPAGTNYVITQDTQTGAITTLPVDSSFSGVMEYDNSTGSLYELELSGGIHLVRIDLSTGATTTIGSYLQNVLPGSNAIFTQLTSDGTNHRVFYGVTNYPAGTNYVITQDTQTGAITTLPADSSFSGVMEYDNSSRKLYELEVQGTNSTQLVSIDTTTGAITPIGTPVQSVLPGSDAIFTQLTSDSTNHRVFYGVTNYPAGTNYVITQDTQTGAITTLPADSSFSGVMEYVPPTPPSISSLTNATINQAGTYITNGSFTDSNSSSWTATVNYGDGSGTNLLTLNSMSFTLNHTYNLLGTFTITVKVIGDSGLTGITTALITVVPSSGLAGANLSHTNYSGADFSGQNLSKADLSVATFNNVNFQSANLSQVNGSNSSFLNDNFVNANLSKINLSNSNLSGSNFTGADLQGANLSGAITTGITWSNTICPNGTNSNNDGGTCVGQGGGL